MKKYKYIGVGPLLTYGMTALGKWRQGAFKVQADDFQHPWSHGWHTASVRDWEEIDRD